MQLTLKLPEYLTMEAVVTLSSTRHLRTRMRLYASIAYAYEDLGKLQGAKNLVTHATEEATKATAQLHKQYEEKALAQEAAAGQLAAVSKAMEKLADPRSAIVKKILGPADPNAGMMPPPM